MEGIREGREENKKRVKKSKSFAFLIFESIFSLSLKRDEITHDGGPSILLFPLFACSSLARAAPCV